MASAASENVPNAQGTGFDPLGGEETGVEARQRYQPVPVVHTPAEIGSEDGSDTARGRRDAVETHNLRQAQRQSTVDWNRWMWTAIYWLGIVAVAGLIVFLIWWYFSDSDDTEKNKESQQKQSAWAEFVSDAPIFVSLFTMYLGSIRILNAGKAMALSYMSHHDTRLARFLRHEDAADRISLLAAALLPTWASLLLLPGLGVSRCRDANNPRLHMPVKTSQDIRGLLDIWWTFMSSDGKFIFGMAQSFKQSWLFSFRNMAMLAVSLTGWSMLETFKGPCWVSTRIFWTWVPVLTAISMMFVVEKRKALLSKPEFWPWLDLVLFCGTLYFAWKSPLDIYCGDPKCW